MARIRHVHSSSRFDRSPASLLSAFRFYTRRKNLVTFTEVTGARRKVLSMLPQWKVYAGHGDCAFAVLRWAFTVEGYGEQALTQELKRHVIAIHADLTHKRSGEKVHLGVTHLPAHLEDPEAMRAWTEATAKWSASWHAAIERGQRPAYVADWNRSWRDPQTRRTIRALFPGGHCTWDRVQPIRGTYGTRLIDYTITVLPVRDPKVLPKNPSSDHRPYSEGLPLS